MRLKSIITAALVVLFFLVYLGTYSINEGQKGLIIRMGKLVTHPSGAVKIVQPGLHFKWPFIDYVRIFDTRLQTLDIKTDPIVTSEKKELIVNYYVQWYISNLPLYYATTSGNTQQTAGFLQQQLNDNLRAQTANYTVQEVVADDESKIIAPLLKETIENAKQIGITIVGIQIKQITFTPEVNKALFEDMRTNLLSLAMKHRAIGKAQSQAIRTNADNTVILTIANAKAKAADLSAQGDASAAKIYTTAYKQDPDFFAFYQSLQAYQKIFMNNKTILVLRPDNAFFKYFNNPNFISGKNTTP